MNLSKKILKAMNEALSLDDEDFDAEDMQLQKVSARYDIDRHNKMAEKIYYLLKIEEIIPDIRSLHSTEALKRVKNICEEHNIKYNPHIDGIEFQLFVHICVSVFGNNANLNWIDTSEVTNMRNLFRRTDFDGDISEWDVSNVTNMWGMFEYSDFNGDISNWDVSNVEYMVGMFLNTNSFNLSIESWDVSNVINMDNMFMYAISFNQPIGNWNVSNVKKMNNMFRSSQSFNLPIGNWNVSQVKEMAAMFYNAKSFNQHIGTWDISNAKDTRLMFDGCPIKEEYKPTFR